MSTGWPGPHAPELALLEIRGDPDFGGDDQEHRRPGRQISRRAATLRWVIQPSRGARTSV